MAEILSIIAPNPTHTSWGLVVFLEGYIAGQRERFITDAKGVFEAIRRAAYVEPVARPLASLTAPSASRRILMFSNSGSASSNPIPSPPRKITPSPPQP